MAINSPLTTLIGLMQMYSQQKIKHLINSHYAIPSTNKEIQDFILMYYGFLGWNYNQGLMTWTRIIHITRNYDLKVTAYGNQSGINLDTVIFFQVATIDGEIVANDTQSCYCGDFNQKLCDWASWVHLKDSDECSERGEDPPQFINYSVRELLNQSRKVDSNQLF